MKNGLTAKQEEALDVVRRLSPGYELTVTTYDDGSTHVFVYDENEEQVALVGKKVQQYYDGKKRQSKSCDGSPTAFTVTVALRLTEEGGNQCAG